MNDFPLIYAQKQRFLKIFKHDYLPVAEPKKILQQHPYTPLKAVLIHLPVCLANGLCHN